ncbi:MAG: hypothetical protein JWM41_4313 [Gemmatimonadetes bacterium]|nr:hypothetical protein [Gemmatimonadota bacterium]
MFYIGFTSSAKPDAGGRKRATGEITLGDDSQRFETDATHWSTGDYESRWRDAVLRLAGEPGASALVTSYHGPDQGAHEIWPMRREGSTVVIRGPVVVDDLDAPTESDGSQSVSEWRFPLGQLLAFAVDE